jgi:FxsC-like protein
MSHWFFLSYARDNSDKYLEKFYRDLDNKIRSLTPPGEGEEGFFDVGIIELGTQWPDVLTAALQKCRTFVSLYSPAYFTREKCGQEWQIFSERQAAYSAELPAHASRPSLLMPILWVPEARLPSPLPDAVSAVQYKHSDFGEVYAREGLQQLMKLSKHRDRYHEFLASFANKLIQAARTHTLPPLPQLPPINEIKNAFHRRGAQAVKLAGEAANVGPRFVQFVFVAGRRDELRAVREKLDPYGEEGGFDWQPFLPEFTDEIGIMAQEVAWREKLHYGFVQLDNDITKRLDEAECQNKIVAIVVDTWTLCLPRYSNFMNEYDRRNFVHCVVLIPWNSRDDETEINRSILVNKMWGTFPHHAVKPDPNCFLDSISSPDELKKGLSVALNKARARITEKAEVMKKAESGQVIGKPRIM